MIIAAIPVKNNLKWTAPLIEGLLLGDEVDEIWVYDNGSIDGTKNWIDHRIKIDGRLKYVNAFNWKFYDMWNHMIHAAANMDGAKLAILNNDIRLPHMALKTMSDNMAHYKIAIIDKEKGSFQNIENVTTERIGWIHRAGWAFMIDADFWKQEEFAIHPDFILWWGDDDLFRRCENRGGQICRIVGVGCDHAVSASDSEYSGNKEHDILKDKDTFSQLWH